MSQLGSYSSQYDTLQGLLPKCTHSGCTGCMLLPSSSKAAYHASFHDTYTTPIRSSLPLHSLVMGLHSYPCRHCPTSLNSASFNPSFENENKNPHRLNSQIPRTQ